MAVGEVGGYCRSYYVPTLVREIHILVREKKGNFKVDLLCEPCITCDRINCYFYHVTGTSSPNLNQGLSRTTVPKRPASHPTPLMHIRLPPSPPSRPLATDTIDFLAPKSPPHTRPYNVASSSDTPDITSACLDQMKDLKSQMMQMQQTQNFLLKNIMSQEWPPLPAQKVVLFQAQMF